MAFVLELQALSAGEVLSGGGCYSHVTSYANTCADEVVQ